MIFDLNIDQNHKNDKIKKNIFFFEILQYN